MKLHLLTWSAVIYLISAVAIPSNLKAKNSEKDHEDEPHASSECKTPREHHLHNQHAHEKRAHFKLIGSSDFGRINLGDHLSRNFELVNDGNKKAKDISFISDTNAISLTGGSCNLNKVKRHSSCQLTFTFAPTSAGAVFATVNMNYKSRGRHLQQTFYFTGEGVALAPSPEPIPTTVPPQPTTEPSPSTTVDPRLDGTFGELGYVTTPIEGGVLKTIDSVPAPDGGLFVLGTLTLGSGEIETAILRYDSTGLLNPDFGNGGIVVFANQGTDSLTNIVLNSTGGILLSGSRLQDGDRDVLLVRLTLEGSLDTAFGVGGLTTVDLGYGDDVATSMFVQPDGKIVLGGYGNIEGNEDMLILRFLSNGQLDLRFNGSGLSAADFSYGNDRIQAMAIDSQNRILVAGRSESGGTERIALVRFTSSGQYDSTFGTQGQYLGDQGTVTNVFVLSNGSIRLAGNFAVADVMTAALWQLTPSGQTDTGFGDNGVIWFEGMAQWHAAELLPNDNMMLTGVSGGELVGMLLNPNGESVWPDRILFDAVNVSDNAGALSLTSGGTEAYISGTAELNGLGAAFVVKIHTQ